MNNNVKKVSYVAPIVSISTAAVAQEPSWTWSQFAGNVAGGALAGATSTGAATLVFGTPAAGPAALVGGAAGAVGGAAYYSLTVAFD